MYDIRQFKPVLYLLLVLGTTGFALASGSPGVWVLGTIGIVANAWLVFSGRFVPMPRLVANLVTLLATGYVAMKVLGSAGTPVIIIGQFLVLLQVIKLWEQRANRDYAQLLVLSLLLMVAAAISTASLAFGVILISYLFLSLYCCLLFHLKVETDAARSALMIPEERLSPQTLRQDQRYLHRSMRKLTGFVSSIAIFSAVLVFLFFPRGTGAGVLGPLQLQAGQALTGFSDQMGFQKVAQIQQNHEIMAYVQLWKGETPVRGDRTILMRGTTLNVYTGKEPRGGPPWQWIRTVGHGAQVHVGKDREAYAPYGEIDEADVAKGERWTQRIRFRRNTGTATLFAMPGVISFAPAREESIFFQHADGVFKRDGVVQYPPEYTVVSTDVPGPALRAHDEFLSPRRSSIDPRIGEYARRAEVSGAGANGRSLAAQRPAEDYVNELDGQIASNIAQHLQQTFSYTLDLTDARDIIAGQDPLVAFLYDLKRGHCEYFAGSMALMCQSLGIQARVVTGFKVGGEDYNELLDRYVVRQSHAHAWVEVRTAEGWRTFDPTSGRDAREGDKNVSLWKRAKHLFNYLEFTYANSVIAYDNENQENLVNSVETGMTRTVWRGAEMIRRLRDSIDTNTQFWIISSNALIGFVGLLALAPVGMALWWMLDRWRLRKRAARIGLESLPPSDQIRLVRQLGFYDDLLRLLERHDIHRPRHLTPREFAESLAYLPATVYESVVRLTELFYRVRYGRTELTHGQHKRLGAVLARVGNGLSDELGPRPGTVSRADR